LRNFKSLCRGPISETVQDSYNSGPFKSKVVCPLSLAVIFSVLSRVKGLRQPQLISTPTNLLSSSSRRLKECVLPRAAVCRRRIFAMMHLRSFCQVFIEEVRRVMTRSVSKVSEQSSAVDRNSEGRRLKIGDNWSYAPPVKNFWLRHCIHHRGPSYSLDSSPTAYGFLYNNVPFPKLVVPHPVKTCIAICSQTVI